MADDNGILQRIEVPRDPRVKITGRRCKVCNLDPPGPRFIFIAAIVGSGELAVVNICRPCLHVATGTLDGATDVQFKVIIPRR